MSSSDPANLAAHFLLEDVLGATTPASRLRGILEAVAAGQPLSALQQDFLDARGYHALRGLARGEIDMEAFRLEAKEEQERRILARAALDKQEDEEQRRRDEESERRNAEIFAVNEAARERRRKARELPDRFGLGYVEKEDWGRVMRILRSVEAGEPIGEQDLTWLGSHGQIYWTDKLRKAHHRIFAERLTEDWRRTGDPWTAVNASSHWRKAGSPEESLSMTQAALSTANHPRLRSALCTTRGGVMRDLRRFEDAVKLGSEAHELTPRNFHPCTLLGAVHIEMGDYAEGAAWYEKAEALGASRDAVDRDLRSILSAAAPEERHRIAAFLKTYDGARFDWIDG